MHPNKPTFQTLRLLADNGSTTASEITASTGTKHPHRCIASLRRIGLHIDDRRLFGNEKVYYLKEKFNIHS